MINSNSSEDSSGEKIYQVEVRHNEGHNFHHRLLSVSTLFLTIATAFLTWGPFRLASEVDNNRANSSIELLLTVADKFGSGVPCAELLSDMSDEELRDLFNLKSMEITSNHINHLNNCFAVSDNNNNKLFIASKTTNKVSLSEYDSAYIVRKVTYDLNLLEIIAASYYSGSSNKEIIKQAIDNLLTSQTFKIVINKINKISEDKYYAQFLGRYMAESEAHEREKEKEDLSK